GGWNAPTRFLPSGVLMPVLLPTAASTMASSVVGTSTAVTPRSQVAATNPARSVVAPPPTPTTASERVTPFRPSADHSSAATCTDLACSPSGTGSGTTRYPASRSAASTRPAISGSVTGWTRPTVRTLSPSSDGSSPSTPPPTTTSYGSAPPTPIRVAVMPAAP